MLSKVMQGLGEMIDKVNKERKERGEKALKVKVGIVDNERNRVPGLLTEEERRFVPFLNKLNWRR